MDKKKSYGMTTGKRIGNGVTPVILNAIMLLFSLSCIFPLVWMLYSSLKVKREFNKDIISLPTDPTIQNFIDVLTNPDYHIGDSILNSVRTTVISVALIVFFGFIVGYFLARIRFKGSKIIWLMLLMGMLTGSQSTTQNVVFSFFGPSLLAAGLNPVFAAVAGAHLAAGGQGMPPADLTTFVVCGMIGSMYSRKVDPVKAMLYCMPMCISLTIVGMVFLYI